MTFTPRQYDIESWLELEKENLLQKICNTYDGNGIIDGQYKTRISIVPDGKYYRGVKSISPASLFRSFSVDDGGVTRTSPPEMREWTQACEDNKVGVAPPQSLIGQSYSSGLLLGVNYDKVEIDYTDPTSDVFNYYLLTILQATLTINYQTDKKKVMNSVTRT